MSASTTKAVRTLGSQVIALRTALNTGKEQEQDRVVQAIERSMLDEVAFETIYDERLLAELFRLLETYYGADMSTQLVPLKNHLDTVRAVHDKLYAILDHEVGIDDLLYLQLSEWPHLDQSIECEYTIAIKRQLDGIRRQKTRLPERLSTFFTTFLEYLGQQGNQDVVGRLQPLIDAALQSYDVYHEHQVYALFVVSEQGEVYGIKLQVSPNNDGRPQISPHDEIGPNMKKAANRALSCAAQICPKLNHYNYKWDIARDDVPYEGESIGLALAVGLLALVDPFDIDAYTAFTGHVDWSTRKVQSIKQLREKLQAAKHLGFRRIFIPRENADEADGIHDLVTIPVSSVDEALDWFRTRSFDLAKTPVEARIRELVLVLRTQGISLAERTDPEEFRTRLVFTDNMSSVPVDVFHGKRGINAQVGGKTSTLKTRVEQARNQVFGSISNSDNQDVGERKHAKYKPSDAELRCQVEEYLEKHPACIRETEENCIYRMRIVRGSQVVLVRQFSSGTLTVDGNIPLFEEIDSALRGLIGVSEDSPGMSDKTARLQAQIAAVEAIELGEAWIGTDESGKGDYFGPLISAAVFVDQKMAEQLSQLGVTDSKKLSDKRINELAPQIYRLCGERCQVITLPPETYNLRYEEFKQERKNLNTLLAWMHTRALENIIRQFKPQGEIVVVIDKFADEHYIQDKLLGESRQAKLRLVQLPKAEANMAVAAASIMARAHFLSRMKGLSEQYQVEFPKGSSDPRIVQVAREIVVTYGPDELGKVAKLHFKTTEQVLRG